MCEDGSILKTAPIDYATVSADDPIILGNIFADLRECIFVDILRKVI